MDQSSQPNAKRKIVVSVALVAVLLAVLIGAYVTTAKKSDDTTALNTPSSSTATPSATPEASTNATATDTSGYKDGTYTATGNYSTPGGQESLGVTLTVAGGVVTDSTVQTMAKSHDSQTYQGIFASNYKSQVTGKKLSELDLDRVSGSSLTPNGFNNAVAQIKTEAAG